MILQNHRIKIFIIYYLIFNPSLIQLYTEVRLLPRLGGNGQSCPIQVMNDSGSDILTLFIQDMYQLGFPHLGCHGWMGLRATVLASGHIEYLLALIVEVRFSRPNSREPWELWVVETAILRYADPGVTRLSGELMRDRFYFGTGPGNNHVAVADTKGGMNVMI